MIRSRHGVYTAFTDSCYWRVSTTISLTYACFFIRFSPDHPADAGLNSRIPVTWCSFTDLSGYKTWNKVLSPHIFGFVIICYVLIKFQSRSIWLNILVYLLNVIECYVSLYTREIVIRDDNSVFVIVSDNPCTSRMPTTMSKKSTQKKWMYESIKHVLLHCIFDISSVTHKFRLISYEKNTCQFDNIVFSTYAD